MVMMNAMINRISIRIFMVVMAVPFFTACVHRSTSVKRSSGNVACSSGQVGDVRASDCAYVRERQLCNVPVGFSVEKYNEIDDTNDNHVVESSYCGSLSCDQVRVFFRRELELGGWKYSEFSQGDEFFWFCRQSPYERMIRLKASAGKTMLCIISKQRKN
ncbi:MAG: hypothetical protein US69_C0010G0019 [candidate division TM6 bacterium GW2011_GWF2_38_10]|nr:MAG: hypothetical protein US69_C0010G0019 [candidate division TM6 bacterium GW2011_GWF2_38_10]